jgi:hypothetical protein
MSSSSPARALHNDFFRVSTSPNRMEAPCEPPHGRRMVFKPRQRTGDTGAMSCVLVDPMIASTNAERWFLHRRERG